MRLVLLGAPGSGKGTQGSVLAAHFGVPHVSSGELLRDHVATDTELGRQVRAYLERGDLVPDELVLDVVGDAIVAASSYGGYVLDGFPRTLAQAQRAFDRAARAGETADAVIYLDVPDDVARARLGLREQSDRTDDADESAVERRLEVFHAETLPLLGFYRERDVLVPVDAVQPPAAVTAAILESLEALDTR